MTITGILQGKRILREIQTAMQLINPTSAPESSAHPPHQCKWEVNGDAATWHSQADPKGEAHPNPESSAWFWFAQVFSSFEARYFMTVMSLVPKNVRLRGTKTFTVNRWLKRQTTENVSMKLKFFKFLQSLNWPLWNLVKAVGKQG